MNRRYQIAGHLFEVSGEELCEAVVSMEGFRPFEVTEGEPVFCFQERKIKDAPEIMKVEYTLEYEGVKGTFGRTAPSICSLHKRVCVLFPVPLSPKNKTALP